MRKRTSRILILLALSACALTSTVHAGQDVFAEVARRTFADLLKTPLAPPAVDVSVHRTTEEDGLVIEDLSWESLDQQRVPAFIVRPARANGPLPVIVCLHGSGGSRDSLITKQFGRGEWQHPRHSKPHQRMLGWARELSRRGYLTLSITQRGLDARTPAINQQANVMLVEGRTAMGAVLYEIRQGITYLRTRPDVDSSYIGATGMSFGGITAFYTWLLDERVTASAPLCGGVGSIKIFSQKGSIGYHGTYWWVPGIIAKGDQAAFAAAMAPRPLMLWAPTEDIGMPREAVDAFIRVVTPAYEQAGGAKDFVVHQQPGEHRFTPEAFQAMNAFFDACFGTR